ncbi:hypothetical protein CTEN210_09015 [Chaetoceros tenuissimus]|uniref:RING-type domain-containing protein n=1 Tax=Chaetoceros tenuissimus TaxID=426638 RepID=A0AAD3CVB3_9STRA|nr:hypothetical protein CTEN210_09015 [Chaetoceros tenuissimus]
MASTSLSFHCTICYEEFNTDSVYPIVMPCGHTYVCNICASKIDKCVECRTSLLKEVTQPQEERRSVSSPRGEPSYGSFTAARSGRRPTGQQRNSSQQPPQQAIVKRERIPLPKNVVLLSLIESSQLVENTSNNRLLSRGAARSWTRESSLDFKDNADADEIEENRIIFGADIANEACGTYAVATTKGLKIVQKRPNSRGEKKAGSRFNTRSVSNGRSISVTRARSPLLDVDDGDEMMSTAAITTGSSKKKLTESWQGKIDEIVVNNVRRKTQNHVDVHLSYGDRVQIVSIVDKWAKLARGYGYVYLENSSDLVKVGGAIDKAAKIESMIYSLSNARNKLMEAKRTTESDAISLLKELQSTLVQEQDVTVIGAEAFDHKDRRDSVEHTGDLREQFSTSFSISGTSINVDSEDGNSVRHGGRFTRFLGNGYTSAEEDRRAAADSDDSDDEGEDSNSTSRSRSNSVRRDRSSSIHSDHSTDSHVSVYSGYSRGSHRRQCSRSTARSAFNVGRTFNSKKSSSIFDCAPANLLQDALRGFSNLVDGSNTGEERDDGGSWRRGSSNDALVLYNGNRKVQYSPEAMAEAAQKWRERNGKEASEFTHIDFRTGMSGHQGLESNYAHQHRYASRGRNAFRMSAHSALTPKRRRQKQTSSSSVFSYVTH